MIAEKHKVQQDSWLKNALNSISDLILIKDARSNIVWANQAFLKAYGTTLDKLVQVIDSDHSDPDDTLQYIKDDAFVVKNKKSILSIEPITFHDGSVHHYEAIKSPILKYEQVTNIIGVFRKVSNQDRIEQSEKGKKERQGFIKFQREFVHSLKTPTLMLDAQCRVVSVSQAFLSLFKLNKFDVVNKSFKNITSEQLEKELKTNDFQLEKTNYSWKIQDMTAVGELTISPWNIDNDNCGGSIVFFKDQTKTIELEKLLLAEKQNSIISDRLQALAELSAGVAHEINNPLSIIEGTLEKINSLQLAEKNCTDQLTACLTGIEKNCSRINAIVKGLKALSRDSSKDDFSECRISSIIDDILALCSQSIKNKEISIEVEMKNDFSLMCKPGEISQALYNLIANSIYEVSSQDKPWVKISVYSSADSHSVNVQDSGSGISKDITNKIFEPFFTTKGLGRGTGLGLGICSRIVSNHGGQLFLNTEHANTTFTMRFKRV